MKNKILLFILLALCSLIYANAYDPEFYFDRFIPIKNNNPAYYKIPMGLSINRNQSLFLGAFNQKVVNRIDTKNELVEIVVQSDNIALTDPIYLTWDDYLNNSFESVFYAELQKAKRELFNQKDRNAVKGLIPEIVIKLPPMAMPRGVRKIMGDKAGRLNLSGTQRLTISASKTSRTNAATSETSSNNGIDFSMKQDLNMNLNGSIGEKIKVDIKYSSNQETNSLIDPNNIKLSYDGDEDEIVQSIEAGNTSLNLSGSRYISVSASSQGLFGVKSVLKIGDLNLTAIASKEESEKNEKTWDGNSQADSTIIRAYNYTSRTNYYINDPKLLYPLITKSEADTQNLPPNWIGNAIKTENGAWYVNENLLPLGNTVKLYLDDNNSSNNNSTTTGFLLDENNQIMGDSLFFDALTEGEDFTVDDKTGLISILKTIPKGYSIGVSYTQKNNVKIGNTDVAPILLKAIRIKNQTPVDSTWIYQARNIYSLGMQNIINDGFKLSIYTESSTNQSIPDVPEEIIHVVEYNNIVDFLRLDSDGNSVVDGNDAAVDLKNGYIIFPFIEPFRALNDSIIYKTEGDESTSDDDFKHYISVFGKVGREQINLGMMILPGSVKVKLENRELTEGVDYTVDYDFGVVTFMLQEAKVPDAKLKISYENKPMFAVESKSLLGLRADWNISDKAKIGSTLIYQSEKVSDKKPKIGNESRSLILADIDGEVKFTPQFMTSMVDFLPLIKTDAPSAFNLSGEIAMNVPRVYNNSSAAHRFEAWLDDMESILETYPLGTSRVTWSPASEPYGTNMIRGRVNYFNPSNVYAKDVYNPSTLSEKEQDEKVNVLSIKVIPPALHIPNPNTPVWAGLEKYIGNQIDFSEKEYIEFLVKVDSVQSYQRPVKMYVDLGDVSEDFYVDFGGLGKLNTEDGLFGNDADGQKDEGEDVGLDGLVSYNDSGQYIPGTDPNDIFDSTEDRVNNVKVDEYSKINGTAKNDKLDTEDLSGSGFDTVERFYRYSAVLTDTTTTMFQSLYNGWYLYRIPLKNNPNVEKLTNVTSEPDLSKISYVRVWFETDGLAKISFINLDVVGNKWTKASVRSRSGFQETIIAPADLSANNEYFAIETIDNQKNRHYTPSPKTTTTGTNDEVSFEQALKIIYNNIPATHVVLSRQRFKDQYNLLAYNKLRFWVYPEKRSDAYLNTDSLDVILRLGSDSLNYYEVTKRVKVQEYNSKMTESLWDEIDFDFKDMTYLKTLNATGDTLYTLDNLTYRKIKSPTLSNIKEIAIGVQVPSGQDNFNGTVYFNEIRVADPNQDIGFAARTTLDTKFADFNNFKLDMEWKTASFSNTNSRTANTSLEDKTSLNISNSVYLQKLFPVQWGLNLPLNLTHTQSLGIPKYKANSDVLRSNLSPEEKEREKNKSLTKQADISFSLSKAPTNKILAYTIKPFTASSMIKESQSSSSTKADTLISWKHSASYKIDIPKDRLDVGIVDNYKLYYFPKYFGNDFTIRGDFPRRWDYVADTTGWRVRPQTINTKQIETANEIKYDILSDLNLNWKFSTKRDLVQRKLFKEYNIGQETERSQEFQSTYDPTYTEKIFDFSVTSQVLYREQRKASKTTNANNQEVITYKFDGNVSRSMRFQSTLKNSNLLASLASLVSTNPNKHYDSNNRESGKDFNETDKGDSKDSENKLNPVSPSFSVGGSTGDLKPVDMNPPRDEKKDKFNSENMDEKDKLTKDEQEKLDSINKEKEKAESEKSEEEKKDLDKKEKESVPEKKKSASVNPRDLLADMIGFTAKLQNISLSYDNQYGSQFDGREGRPDYLYQLGIPNIVANSELRAHNIDDTFSASSGFPLFTNLSTDFRYSTTINKRYSSSNSQSISTTWPDIRVTLGGFETLINAENILSSSRLSSAFTYNEKLSGDINWKKPNTEVITTSFQPLIGFTGNWANDISSSASLNQNSTKSISHQSTMDIIKNTNKLNITGNVKYTFTAENGFKIPLLGKRLSFKNQMESELTVTYEDEISTTLGRDKQVDRNTTKLSFVPRATYNFHRNVKGGLTGSYDITKDNKKGSSINIFKLDIWAEIQF